jgi:ubiquinone biosynthesis protein
MVMVEGVATGLDPDINLWVTAAPLVEDWIRTELGPEAAIADRLVADVRTLARLPELVRRIEARFPAPGGAPPRPPLREIERVRVGGGWRYALAGAIGVAAGIAGMLLATGW